MNPRTHTENATARRDEAAEQTRSDIAQSATDLRRCASAQTNGLSVHRMHLDAELNQYGDCLKWMTLSATQGVEPGQGRAPQGANDERAFVRGEITRRRATPRKGQNRDRHTAELITRHAMAMDVVLCEQGECDATQQSAEVAKIAYEVGVDTGQGPHTRASARTLATVALEHATQPVQARENAAKRIGAFAATCALATTHARSHGDRMIEAMPGELEERHAVHTLVEESQLSEALARRVHRAVHHQVGASLAPETGEMGAKKARGASAAAYAANLTRWETHWNEHGEEAITEVAKHNWSQGQNEQALLANAVRTRQTTRPRRRVRTEQGYETR